MKVPQSNTKPDTTILATLLSKPFATSTTYLGATTELATSSNAPPEQLQSIHLQTLLTLTQNALEM